MGASGAAAQTNPKVLIYSGTVAHRHSEAINAGIGPIRDALTAAGIASDWEDCNGYGTAAGQCQHPDKNPRIFTPANLEQYDALFMFNAGGDDGRSGAAGPLWSGADRDAIRGFTNAGGGIVANHLATDIGAGEPSWDWWDGMGDSAIGSTMPGHPAAPQTANVRVADRNHVATKGLPEEFAIADEFYMFHRSVRGTHHVVATLDENTPGFNPGQFAMGQDHPVAWCRDYDGGRVFATSLGHYGNLYTPVNGQPSNLVKLLTGGVQWAAGLAGNDNDCRGTVWNNFRRTTLANDLNGPVSLDVASDGRVFWTEIGAPGHNSSGRVRVYDPETQQTSLVATIQTRADALGASEDGVLGMSLDPNFDENNYFYVYYSPRGEGENWPNTGAGMVLGHNVISRFELNEAGTAVIDEQEIIRIPKVKVAPDGDGGPQGATTNWPAHTGGAGMDFDPQGNLVVGVGDDVNPYDANRNWTPIDQRYEHRYDARNTAANTNDLRGKILRIKPRPNADGAPGVGTTYDIPAGNMFPPGTEKTKPEIYAMGFRNPFTVHADPERPGVVVVGEYGPDSGTNNPNRGPAGIIEWNHITKPGFYGWPFCTGDNSTANTYFRFTYPSGPTGAQFDCSLEQIPNESTYNTGLSTIPGPAIKATIWHKRDGTTSPRFGIPTATGSQEPNSGPIYRYDPDNPSETKWPQYFDGSWIVYNRSMNWWTEAKLKSDDTLLGANPFIAPSSLGSGPASYALGTRFGPDGALYLASWPGGGRGDQAGSGQLMRVDYVGDLEDTEGPVVTATVEGRTAPGNRYVGNATVRLNSQDAGVSGTAQIEYRVDGGEWQTSRNTTGGDPYSVSIPLDGAGTYGIEYRAADREGNASDTGRVDVVVIPAASCTFSKSDEFTGSTIAPRWTLRSGPNNPITQSGGSLVLPVVWELDGTATGPLSFAGQPLPSGDWSMTTRVTIDNTMQWQSAGLYLWQSDNNFIKFGITFQATGRTFEMTSDNPPNGTREFSANESAAGYGTTVWLRLYRQGNTIRGQYAKDVNGRPGEWVNHSGSRPVNTTPPREGAGVLGGPYAGGQQNAPWNLTAAFDHVHYTPDTAECVGDLDAPTTSATVNGAAPVETYTGPVDVALSATDGSGGGVASIEYRMGATGAWTKKDNTGSASPFVVELDVADAGAHRIQYRATDKAGNVGAIKELAFTIEDQDVNDVYASDAGNKTTWVPDAIRVTQGETVTWHFDSVAQGGQASTPHNVYVVRPGDDPLTKGFLVSDLVVPAGGPPASYAFNQRGTWTFYCSFHSYPNGSGGWTGMVGTVEVSAGQGDETAPTTTATVTGDGTPAATVRLSADDAASGVAHIDYAVNGELPEDGSAGPGVTRLTNAGTTNPFVGEFRLTTPGTYTVRYRATDREGNREAVKTQTVTVTDTPSGEPVEKPVTVRAQVPKMLALDLDATADLGSFLPGTTATYSATLTGKVTSSEAASALTVHDPSPNATGKLVNGSYALPQPLQLRGADGAFAPLTGQPLSLVRFTTAVGSRPISVDLRQSIAETDSVLAGAYSKTLVFTLSATTP
ncbi:ThuA domain-containing protein [Solirubrobacter sp. CPCC 204708]|uniref:ThuA domain-containing protein n=1 Tax=Solirubrobacter deserti TaxID=2282478 RepID=A0ABT4RBK9_9ACTN|nr:ThuA domain-containing protein [Solirubrobacter deserti]MBE2317195.1 ThuA domain-containing protein [Solirubrobacter deserti]MDA0135912.1 ThuA domain-containing protein [Solirubrobacter deserti]